MRSDGAALASISAVRLGEEMEEARATSELLRLAAKIAALPAEDTSGVDDLAGADVRQRRAQQNRTEHRDNQQSGKDRAAQLRFDHVSNRLM